MQLCEIQDAIDGYVDGKIERFNELMVLARLISFYAVAPHLAKSSKIKKPEDLFELEIDKVIKGKRNKNRKPSQVIRHAK